APLSRQLPPQPSKPARGVRRGPPRESPTFSMSLPDSSAPRQRLHQRSIPYDCFRRDDGLFEIDAHLVDAKDHDYELLTGTRPAREAVHDMYARVTIDANFVIHAIEVR